MNTSTLSGAEDFLLAKYRAELDKYLSRRKSIETAINFYLTSFIIAGGLATLLLNADIPASLGLSKTAIEFPMLLITAIIAVFGLVTIIRVTSQRARNAVGEKLLYAIEHYYVQNYSGLTPYLLQHYSNQNMVSIARPKFRYYLTWVMLCLSIFNGLSFGIAAYLALGIIFEALLLWIHILLAIAAGLIMFTVGWSVFRHEQKYAIEAMSSPLEALYDLTKQADDLELSSNVEE